MLLVVVQGRLATSMSRRNQGRVVVAGFTTLTGMMEEEEGSCIMRMTIWHTRDRAWTIQITG